jgi:putative DNA methylase
VELEGTGGLTHGANRLVDKIGSRYRLRDFMERGSAADLGRPNSDGTPASLIDQLHRVLWLTEYRPGELPAYLDEVQPDAERLRVVAQTLAGPALSGGDIGAKVSPTGEAAALRKLTTNWRSLVEDTLFRKR